MSHKPHMKELILAHGQTLKIKIITIIIIKLFVGDVLTQHYGDYVFFEGCSDYSNQHGDESRPV